MKLQSVVLAIATSLATFGVGLGVKAQTVEARCDVYPAGEDRATSSGLCSFAQRQGTVAIQLQDGRRYELQPVGTDPGNYVDQDGRAAYRQAGLDDRGQIYRLANESIYVYWDTAPYGSSPTSATSAASVPNTPNFATLSASDPNARINVRSAPTINSSTPSYGVVGDRVQIIRCVQDTDTSGSDLNWCDVRFSGSGATGWIRSDFMIFSDGGE
ncbi:SH3 domain-containing protein [Leptolyngbya ohadii]|uniref:SH3 domain-containing protein n=1 Tax=Leptolyngbya ohadii TaxID=1962290 RepID=UPI000B59DD2B|nr:SH3 domain-containing protein [Leptolyngbya ohadii]